MLKRGVMKERRKKGKKEKEKKLFNADKFEIEKV